MILSKLMRKGNFLEFWLYLTAFMVGVAVLVLEVLGTRIIAPFYGSSIFVWTSLITVTLGGLALGYYGGGKLIDRHPKKECLYKMVFLSGLGFFWPTKIVEWILPATDKFGLRYGPLMASLGMFLVPLIVLGMVTPMVVRLVTKKVKESGGVAGKVFAWSTVGSIVGAWLVGFYLLDKVGVKQILMGTGLTLLLISIVGISREKNFRKKWWLIGLFLVVFLVPSYKYVDDRNLEILHREQGFYGDLKVVEGGGFRCVLLNGAAESCRYKEGVGGYFEAIAELVNQTGGEKLLVLGSGGGDLIEGGIKEDWKVDLVDIDGRLVELGKEYLGFEPSEEQRVVIDDARHFLSSSSETYDVVFVDLFKGYEPPDYMFSKEALQDMKERLDDKGVVMINMLGGVGSDDKVLASILITLKEVFPFVEVMTSEVEDNSTFLIYASLDSEFSLGHKMGKEFGYEGAEVNMDLGKVLTDNFNPMGIYFLEKNEVIWRAVRRFGGFKSGLI